MERLNAKIEELYTILTVRFVSSFNFLVHGSHDQQEQDQHSSGDDQVCASPPIPDCGPEGADANCGGEGVEASESGERDRRVPEDQLPCAFSPVPRAHGDPAYGRAIRGCQQSILLVGLYLSDDA